MPSRQQTIPISRTKLHRPRAATDLVYRQELHSRLDDDCCLPLTLISCPIGHGKSTAITHWLEEQKFSSAWESLDKGDCDLRVFRICLVAAIGTSSPEARDTAAVTDASETPLIATLSGSLGEDVQ